MYMFKYWYCFQLVWYQETLAATKRVMSRNIENIERKNFYWVFRLFTASILHMQKEREARRGGVGPLPPTRLSLLFCAGLQFSRDSIYRCIQQSKLIIGENSWEGCEQSTASYKLSKVLFYLQHNICNIKGRLCMLFNYFCLSGRTWHFMSRCLHVLILLKDTMHHTFLCPRARNCLFSVFPIQDLPWGSPS